MKKAIYFEFILIITVLGLAAFLRLANLASNPGWYTDEGTHLNIARNLLNGRVQYMAVGESTLLFARLPLFEYLLAGLIAIFGVSMLTLRTFTALLGVTSVGLTWLLLRRLTENSWLALSGALSFAVYPTAILYSRWGFSYNLLTVFILLTVWSLGEFQRAKNARWLILSVIALGLGCISDIAMLVLVIPFVIVLAVTDWRQLRWTLPLIFMPFGFYVGYMLWIEPVAFRYDLDFTFNRVQASPDQQAWNIARNYTILLTQDIRVLGGLLGLFLLKNARLRWLLLGFTLLPIILIGRVVSLYGLNAYYLIPILPFFAIGFGVLLYTSAVYLQQLIPANLPEHITQYQRLTQTLTASVIILLIGMPLIVEMDETARRIQTHWDTPIENALVESDSAQIATDYVNEHLQSGETVIVAPTLAWRIEGNVVDFITAPAILTDDDTHIFWETIELPLTRFRYDPRYTHARYAIVDNLWRDWGRNLVDGVAPMLDDIETHWEPVLQIGTVIVYENPLYKFNG